MTRLSDHLAILPVLIPLLAGAVMILLGEQRRRLKAGLGVASMLAQAVVAVRLAGLADAGGLGPAIVYRLGNWPAQFGIVLVVDRLSAMMLVLAACLGLAALLFGCARWHRAGTSFHALMQFQLMGINGAFLTGDLFNLFVFFEVMLAASYGLVLHGSGAVRVRAGLHYIAVNLAASLLFLVGASLIYGVAGTLNMADLAARIPDLTPDNLALLKIGASILGIAFLIKAGMWPLGFWLPTTYAAASAPAAALLSLLSKVGLYAILRLWLLLFGAGAGASQGFGAEWLLAGGLLTLAFGTAGVLAAQDTARLAGSCVVVSSGTVLAALGTGQPGLVGGLLFYVASAVPAIAAFFLLIELIERGRDPGADVLAVSMAAFGAGEEEDEFSEGEPGGFAMPGTLATLGTGFLLCSLLLAGVPPLSGFLGKLAILSPLVGAGAPGPVAPGTWLLLAALVLSGLATMVAMARTGIGIFWVSFPDGAAQIRLIEALPIAFLLLLSLALTVLAGPAMRYTHDAAQALQRSGGYIGGVLEHAP